MASQDYTPFDEIAEESLMAEAPANALLRQSR